jgi:hypothetical protein
VASLQERDTGRTMGEQQSLYCRGTEILSLFGRHDGAGRNAPALIGHGYLAPRQIHISF